MYPENFVFHFSQVKHLLNTQSYETLFLFTEQNKETRTQLLALTATYNNPYLRIQSALCNLKL